MYLSGEWGKPDLPKHLQCLSDDELRKEYNKRFPILFAKSLQNIANQLINGEIVMNIHYK